MTRATHTARKANSATVVDDDNIGIRLNARQIIVGAGKIKVGGIVDRHLRSRHGKKRDRIRPANLNGSDSASLTRTRCLIVDGESPRCAQCARGQINTDAIAIAV